MMPGAGGWGGFPGGGAGGYGGGGGGPFGGGLHHHHQHHRQRFEEQYHCYSVAFADKAHVEVSVRGRRGGAGDGRGLAGSEWFSQLSHTFFSPHPSPSPRLASPRLYRFLGNLEKTKPFTL